MTLYLIPAVLVVLASALLAYHLWYKPRYITLQEWLDSTSLGWGNVLTQPGQTDKDPAWLWFKENDWGMARRGVLKLTKEIQTLLDRTLEAKRWKTYVPDPPILDWESLTDAHRAGAGDCEDAARVFADALIKAGIDPSCLSYYFVMLPMAGDHALLAIDTDKGTYCADHTTSRFRPWNEYPRVDSGFPRRLGPDGVYYLTER